MQIVKRRLAVETGVGMVRAGQRILQIPKGGCNLFVFSAKRFGLFLGLGDFLFQKLLGREIGLLRDAQLLPPRFSENGQVRALHVGELAQCGGDLEVAQLVHFGSGVGRRCSLCLCVRGLALTFFSLGLGRQGSCQAAAAFGDSFLRHFPNVV